MSYTAFSQEFTHMNPRRSLFGKYTSGQGRLRVFFGPGRVLLNPAPYWRYRIFAEHEDDKPFLAYSE
jgi:uncharacterized protein (AIM24 family)